MPQRIVKRKQYSYSGKKTASHFSEDASAALQKPLDGLIYLSTHYGRFARDVLGIIMIFASLLTLFALLGLTGGVLLLPL
jgi:hypothetical protein